MFQSAPVLSLASEAPSTLDAAQALLISFLDDPCCAGSAGAALVSLVATSSSFPVPATGTSANTLSLAVLLNAAMDIVQVHDGDRLNR